MKLNFLKSVCISAMAIILVACGSNTAETTVETPDAVTEEVNEPTPEPEMMQTYYVEVSDTGYRSLRTVGEGLYCFYDDETEKYGIIDIDGNVLKEPEYKYVDISKDGNYIISSIETDDGFVSELYDSELNLIWTNEEYPNYIMYEYSDGVAHLLEPDNNIHIYIDVANGAKPLFAISPEQNQYFILSFGCRGDFIPLEIRGLYDQGFLVGIDKEKNDIWSPEINGKTFSPSSAMSSDGWMFGILVNMEVDGPEFAFYNYLTGEVVNDQTEDHNYSVFNECGVENCTVMDGKAFHIVKYENEGEEPYSTYEVFDLTSQSFIGEFKNAIVSHDNIKLVKNMDDTWAYTDENYKQISDGYEDASVFGDDMALVVIDGKANIINRDFENITDTTVEVPVDSVIGSGFNTFAVGKDDLYYMAKIVEGTLVEVQQ